MNKNRTGPAVAIIGLVLVAVGGVALLLRPSAVAHPTALLETSLAVVPAEALSQPNLMSITFTAPGMLDLRTARPADAYAWVQGGHVTVVRGLDTWEDLGVERVWTAGGPATEFPGDVWRTWDNGFHTATIAANDIEPGAALVVVSAADAHLSTVTFEVSRERGNTWAPPVLALGLLAIAVGLVWMVVSLVRATAWWVARAARRSPITPVENLGSPTTRKAGDS